MRTSQNKKFHDYSLSFYRKEVQLANISSPSHINFQSFENKKRLLKDKTLSAFKQFLQQNKATQRTLLQKNSQLYIDSLFDIIKHINFDRDLMEFVLPTLDSILTTERSVLRQVVQGINLKKYTILSDLKSILNVPDHKQVSYDASSRCLAILYGELPKQMLKQMNEYLLCLMNLRKQAQQNNKICQFSLISSLHYLIKHQQLAIAFLENNGSYFLIQILNRNSSDVQLYYYTLINIWLLSFTEKGKQQFLGVAKLEVIKAICLILQKISREKLVRMAFNIFKNIQNHNKCLELMIDNKLLKIIDTLLKGTIKQEKLVEDIKNVGQILEQNIKVLSSFDKYIKQLNNETLEWSSVHTQRFWKQNAIKFEANDFLLLRKLRQLLAANNQNLINHAIACYDFGEFTQHYPRGKIVIEELKIKELIMQRAKYSKSKIVRQQALLALQKILIQNWESI